MEQKQLEDLRVWFDEYVGGFYGEDEFVNANLKLKEEHSRRVCNEILYLAEHLGLGGDKRRTAEATALLHDIGRFRQFVRYGTYNDPKSVNHCKLGVEVLREEKVLDGLEKEEREYIETAIDYHGLRELPSGLDGDGLKLCQLLRDADKLDIFYLVVIYNKQYQNNPEKFMLELEFPDEPRWSGHVVEAIMSRELIEYSTLETLNDMKLLQLGWVYDVNFAATLRRLKERRLLEQMASFLPKAEEMEMVKAKIFDYVEQRI